MKWREKVNGSIRRIGLKEIVVADRCRWREDVRRVAKIVHLATCSHWRLNWSKTEMIMMMIQ